MATNLHLQDEIYRQVGQEVARNEFHPGPMARAVSESNGNHDLVRGLYIKFRVEELYRQTELEVIAEHEREGLITCPHCGHVGKPNRKPRGNALLLLILFLAFVIPGYIYAIFFNGYKGVCPKCEKTLIQKM